MEQGCSDMPRTGHRKDGGMTNVIIAAMSIILAVESNGGMDVRDGDGGRARGAYQIHAVAVREVNRLYGTSYRHSDAYDFASATKMCWLTLEHHYRRGVTNALDLACKWNRHYGKVNPKYRRKVLRVYSTHYAEYGIL